MRNVWIQTDFAFATWVADLSAIRGQPRALLEAVVAILDAGARHRVFTPVELGPLGFRRGHDGNLLQLLAAQWEGPRVVDAFGFTGAAMAPGAPGSSTVEADMAWFDHDDALRVAPTTDLGAVLRALEPVPGSIGEGFTVPFPPVQITGRRLTYQGEPPKLEESQARRPIEIRVALHSDIWFPYVFGSAHPLADHRRYFDNRELAALHTPRLNGFLRDVAAVTAAAGGRWQVDLEETGTDAQRWLDASGVRLESLPPELFPAEAFAAQWF
ncbi:MAG TPA: hypothetical protein PKU97_07455 [Kofleriaceae bacterium]|nr:hypothetical protein [Kofleriaceae bacterium]